MKKNRKQISQEKFDQQVDDFAKIVLNMVNIFTPAPDVCFAAMLLVFRAVSHALMTTCKWQCGNVLDAVDALHDDYHEFVEHYDERVNAIKEQINK